MTLIQGAERRLTSITEDRIASVTPAYFSERYGYRKIPVVFRTAFQHWPIRERWTPDYLSDRIGDRRETLTSLNNEVEQTLSLAEYLTGLNNNAAAEYYFTTQQHLRSELAEQYTAPAPFRCWYRNYTESPPKTVLSWLYVGAKGSYSTLHSDVWNTSAWNYLVSGRKLWIFYPLQFSRQIVENPDTYGLDAILRALSLGGELPPVRPLVCIQQPGELVYTPSKMWHAVYNLDDSIALTENFVNTYNYEDVLAYFRRSGEENYRHMKKVVFAGFTPLKSQPHEYASSH